MMGSTQQITAVYEKKSNRSWRHGLVNSLNINSLVAAALAVIFTVAGCAFNVVIDEKRGMPSAAVTYDELIVLAFGACTGADQLRTQTG